MLRLRATLTSLYIIVATFVLSLVAIASFAIWWTGEAYLWIAYHWVHSIFFVGGIKSKSWVDPKLDKNENYLYLSNHESLTDILALLGLLPQRVVMVAKRSLLMLPVFSWGMWLAGFVFINRKNRAAAFRSMEKAGHRMRKGRSVLVFPEGTRGDGGPLLPFKKGGFYLAQATGFAVVPVGIHGTRAILPRDTFPVYPGRIAVCVGAPMPPPKKGEPLEPFMQAVAAEVDRLRTEARAMCMGMAASESPPPAA